jgi:type I restriction enzyme S subunit
MRVRWESSFKEAEFGLIPADWGEATLQEMASIDPTPNATRSGKIGFISMEGISEQSPFPSYEILEPRQIRSGKEVPSGSVLLAKITPSLEHGKMCIVPDNPDIRWFATTEVFSLVAQEPELTKFLFYVMKHPVLREELENSMTGTSGRQRVQPLALHTLHIPHPTKEEQIRISRFLFPLDLLLENLKRQNQNLELLTNSIFRSWFIDFNKLKDKRLVTSELGGIPEGWSVQPIGEIAKLRNGFSYGGAEKLDEETEDSHLFITLNNFVEGGGFKPEYAWVSSDRLAEHHFLTEGDLIMTNTHFGVGGSDVGRLLATPALVNLPPAYQKARAVYSHHVTRISPMNINLREFLYLYLKATWEDSVSFATGTGVLGLDLRNFRLNKLVLVPPNGVIDRFSSIVRPMFHKIMNNQKEAMILSALRNLLLEFVVFGKLRVEEV